MTKNEVFARLVGIKRLVADVWTCIEDNDYPLVCGYSPDGVVDGMINIRLTSNRPGKKLDWEIVNEFMKQYDFDGFTNDTDESVEFKVREVPLKFNQLSITLVDYITDYGISIPEYRRDELSAGMPELFDFLRDNPDYSMKVSQLGEVIIN